jgi:hypothetical protein
MDACRLAHQLVNRLADQLSIASRRIPRLTLGLK